MDRRATPARFQLLLLTPSSRRPAIRNFVRHIQAALEPGDLARLWRDAPDVFFARLPALSSLQLAYLGRWLETHPTQTLTGLS